MGQDHPHPLPLPQRIPNPSEDQKKSMDECGIKITSSGEFVEYDLPSGWEMVDNSTRRDLPQFFIVD